jgi:hypothetical protein
VSSVLVAMLWTAVTAYAVWRFAAVLEKFAPVQPKDQTPVAVPHDLMALALSHEEEWAQEDVMKAIRERYELTNDWNAVRMAFGIGRMDA